MESMQQLKNRIESIIGTRQITQSMRLVSTVRMRAARDRMLANATFQSETERMALEAASDPDVFDHPYVRGKKTKYTTNDNPNEKNSEAGSGRGGRKCVIIIGADRGLCGGYNINVYKEARALLRKLDEVILITVGQKMKDYFAQREQGGHGVYGEQGGQSEQSGQGKYGGYNGQGVQSEYGEKSGQRTQVGHSGQRGQSVYGGRGGQGGTIIAESYTGISETPFFEDAEAIAKIALDLYDSGEVDSIYLVHTRFINMLIHKPAQMLLLPYSEAAGKSGGGGRSDSKGDGGGDSRDGGNDNDGNDSGVNGSRNIGSSGTGAVSKSAAVGGDGNRPVTPAAAYARYGALTRYEPRCADFLTHSTPFYIASALFGAILESSVCEQCSRTISMDTAVKNSDEMISALTLKYNKARQDAITVELADIIGGTKALKLKAETNSTLL